MKMRLDKLLMEQGRSPSRERAQALILAGRVLVNEQKVEKPGALVAAESEIRLLGDDLRYVSRGGIKLEAALEHWSINLANRQCADIGASTGGFTDCMLQHGAAQVVAIDTGYGQIAHRLRSDARVRLLERTNARYLPPDSLPAEISFFAMDVSFISATLVLPAVLAALGVSTAAELHPEPPPQPLQASRGPLDAVILVKPQFEAGKEHVGKGGIVRDPAAHRLAIQRVWGAAETLGASKIDQADSPITGAEGNREFLLYARFREGASESS